MVENKTLIWTKIQKRQKLMKCTKKVLIKEKFQFNNFESKLQQQIKNKVLKIRTLVILISSA